MPCRFNSGHLFIINNIGSLIGIFCFFSDCKVGLQLSPVYPSVTRRRHDLLVDSALLHKISVTSRSVSSLLSNNSYYQSFIMFIKLARKGARWEVVEVNCVVWCLSKFVTIIIITIIRKFNMNLLIRNGWTGILSVRKVATV